VGAYRENYILLYERGKRFVDNMQNELKHVKEENQKYIKQAEFGVEVIEHLKSKVSYFTTKYPNDPTSLQQDDTIMEKYESMKNEHFQLQLEDDWHNKYINERRHSEVLQKETINLKDELQKVKSEMEIKQIAFENEQAKIVNDVNTLWTSQLLEVFQQVEKKGIDVSEISIPKIAENDEESFKLVKADQNSNYNYNFSINNKDNDNENPSIKNLKKNLVRIYTKTEWNENDLDLLQEEINKEFNALNKTKINQMTDPSRFQDENQLHYQKLYEELQKNSEQAILEYKERLKEQQEQFDEEREVLIQSKMQLVNSVSNELQNLRDLIRAYNPATPM